MRHVTSQSTLAKALQVANWANAACAAGSAARTTGSNANQSENASIRTSPVSKFTGSYSASVSLEDDTILTISGSSQAGNSWAAVNTTTDFHAIRWKPVKSAAAAAK